MNAEKQEKHSRSCKISSIVCHISVVFFILLLLSCCCVRTFFVGYIQKGEVFTTHDLKFDEKLLDQIDSLDRDSVSYRDTVALKQEVRQLRRLVKYVIDREAKYQMEVDLIIDKYSQWTGYWLSVIGCVLTLFTLLQAFLNYRSNDDNTKKSEKAVQDCQYAVGEVREQYKNLVCDMQLSIGENITKSEKAVLGCRHAIKQIGSKYDDLVRDMQLSVYQNKLSCISTCLSSFPDAFSLTPNEERQKFIRVFLKMLYEEYSDFTNGFDSLRDHQCKRSGVSREIGYAYLVWCDISIAVNHAMYDFKKPEQNRAFDGLKRALGAAITDYHNQEINNDNIVARMRDIRNAMGALLGVL